MKQFLKMKNMSPENLFEDIKKRAIQALEKRNNQLPYRTNWGLSICATPIQFEEIMIIGINWGGGGVSDKYEYTVQEHMPSFDEFKSQYEKNEYRFLKRINNFSKIFLSLELSEGKFNYSNLCFFRTPDVKKLEDKDFEVCAEIFECIINKIRPKKIISFGTGNIKYLKKYFNEKFKAEPVTVEGTSHTSFVGSLCGFKFYNLPHPMARKLSDDTYAKIWHKLFSNVHNNL